MAEEGFEVGRFNEEVEQEAELLDVEEGVKVSHVVLMLNIPVLEEGVFLTQFAKLVISVQDECVRGDLVSILVARGSTVVKDGDQERNHGVDALLLLHEAANKSIQLTVVEVDEVPLDLGQIFYILQLKRYFVIFLVVLESL